LQRREIGAAAANASAVRCKFQTVRRADETLLEAPAADADQGMGQVWAAVAHCLHVAERIPHQQNAFDPQIHRDEVLGSREFGLVRHDLPGSPEQRIPLE
jgi:hypothetical protein